MYILKLLLCFTEVLEECKQVLQLKEELCEKSFIEKLKEIEEEERVSRKYFQSLTERMHKNIFSAYKFTNP